MCRRGRHDEPAGNGGRRRGAAGQAGRPAQRGGCPQRPARKGPSTQAGIASREEGLPGTAGAGSRSGRADPQGRQAASRETRKPQDRGRARRPSCEPTEAPMINRWPSSPRCRNRGRSAIPGVRRASVGSGRMAGCCGTGCRRRGVFRRVKPGGASERHVVMGLRLAQLDRASGSQPDGRWFKSSIVPKCKVRSDGMRKVPNPRGRRRPIGARCGRKPKRVDDGMVVGGGPAELPARQTAWKSSSSMSGHGNSHPFIKGGTARIRRDPRWHQRRGVDDGSTRPSHGRGYGSEDRAWKL